MLRTPAPLAAAMVAALPLCPGTVRASRTIDLAGQTWPVIVGTQQEEQFGYAAAAGDLDGDGRPEVVVGAPGRRSDSDHHLGAVYVLGGAALADARGQVRAADVALSVIVGPPTHARFGASIAVADLDGDGLSDVVVGAPSEGEGPHVERGSVYVFFSKPGQPSPRTALEADLTIRGERAGDTFGTSVLAADIDGDGTVDLVASAARAGAPARPGAGAVYVVDGAALRGGRGEMGISGLARAVIEGDRPGDSLSALAVGDFDGDGRVDLALGAPLSDGPSGGRTDAGAVYVVPTGRLAGGRAGVSRTAAATVLGGRERGFLGRTIAAADIDDDGIADLLVPAHASSGETKEESVIGEAFVLFGSASGSPAPLDLATAGTPVFRGLSRWDIFGFAVMLADMNGDGQADIVASAPFAGGDGDSRPRCGEVCVFWGGVRSVVRAKAGSSELADIRIVGAGERDAIGSCLIAVRAGGAKTPDLLIGAPDAPVTSGCGDRCGKLIVVPAAAGLGGR